MFRDEVENLILTWKSNFGGELENRILEANMKLEANGNFLTETANEFHKGLFLIRESPFDLKANCFTKKKHIH